MDAILRTPSLSLTLLGVQSQVSHSTVTCPGFQPEPPLLVSLLLLATVPQTVIRLLHVNVNGATKEQRKHESICCFCSHPSWQLEQRRQQGTALEASRRPRRNLPLVAAHTSGSASRATQFGATPRQQINPCPVCRCQLAGRLSAKPLRLRFGFDRDRCAESFATCCRRWSLFRMCCGGSVRVRRRKQ